MQPRNAWSQKDFTFLFSIKEILDRVKIIIIFLSVFQLKPTRDEIRQILSGFDTIESTFLETCGLFASGTRQKDI